MADRSKKARELNEILSKFKNRYPDKSLNKLAKEISEAHPEIGKLSYIRVILFTWNKMSEEERSAPINSIKTGTIYWYISTNPQNIGEEDSEYKNRIFQIVKSAGVCGNKNSVTRALNTYRSKWVQTHETEDGDGNVVSRKFKVEKKSQYDKSQLEIESVTENPYGPDWVKYKKGSYAPPPIDKKLIEETIGSINIVERIDFKKTHQSDSLLRLVYTDVHIGMETNEKNGLYGGIWNAKELELRKNDMVREVLSNYNDEEEIHLVDLGDLMDGWDQLTTRGGHKLPQNMNNREAFRTAIKFKVELADTIQKYTGAKIKCFNILEDNHSGDFAGVVNDAAKKIIEQVNDAVTYRNIEKFIEHYTWNNHAFILCHGKDSKEMRFGFKPKLDDTAKGKIEDYIRIHRLYDHYVTFEKGDSHQQLFDYDTSDQFNYFNYRALSPSSNWVQTNFKRGTSGFMLEKAYVNKRELSLIPSSYEWKEG